MRYRWLYRLVAVAVVAATLVYAGLAIFDTDVRYQRKLTDAELRQLLTERLRGRLSAAYLSAEAESAFARNNVEDVDILIDAAGLAGTPVPSPILQRREEERGVWRTLKREGASCLIGGVFGVGETTSAIACSGIADFTEFGDLREVAGEVLKYANNEDPDWLMLGLTATSIGMTLAMPVSGGTSAAGKASVSVLKTGVKSKWLSPHVAHSIVNTAKKAVDARKFSDAARAGFPAGIRKTFEQSVDMKRMEPLVQMADKIYGIYSAGAVVDAVAAVKTARQEGDLDNSVRISRAFSGKLAPVLRVLGDDAFSTARKTITVEYRDWAKVRTLLADGAIHVGVMLPVLFWLRRKAAAANAPEAAASDADGAIRGSEQKEMVSEASEVREAGLSACAFTQPAIEPIPTTSNPS